VPGRRLTALAFALALAGCSDDPGASVATTASSGTPAPATAPAGSATTTGPASTGAPPTTTAGAAQPCPSGSLALMSREGLSALGHALYVLQLRNTSSQPCRLSGYPAVSLVAATGRVLAEARPGEGFILPDRPPAAVSVPAGGSAYFGVESSTICDGNAEPAVSDSVRVTPPGATGPLAVGARINVCPNRPVRVSPVRASERDIAP